MAVRDFLLALIVFLFGGAVIAGAVLVLWPGAVTVPGALAAPTVILGVIAAARLGVSSLGDDVSAPRLGAAAHQAHRRRLRKDYQEAGPERRRRLAPGWAALVALGILWGMASLLEAQGLLF